MDIGSLYGANTTTQNTNAKTNAANSTKNANSASAQGVSTKGKDSLDVSDFLSLIAAQLQNQDMMNPVQDTEFIAQLAQFTTLETTEKLLEATNASLELSNTNYAASLLGKDVTVAKAKTDKDGNTILETHVGTVSGVSLFEGRPLVYIGNDAYELYEIMAVGKIPEKVTTPDKEETGGTENGGNESGGNESGGGDNSGGEV